MTCYEFVNLIKIYFEDAKKKNDYEALLANTLALVFR